MSCGAGLRALRDARSCALLSDAETLNFSWLNKPRLPEEARGAGRLEGGGGGVHLSEHGVDRTGNPRASCLVPLAGHHGGAVLADFGDFHLQLVAGHERAYAGGGAGEHDIAGLEGEVLGGRGYGFIAARNNFFLRYP